MLSKNRSTDKTDEQPNKPNRAKNGGEMDSGNVICPVQSVFDNYFSVKCVDENIMTIF